MMPATPFSIPLILLTHIKTHGSVHYSSVAQETQGMTDKGVFYRNKGNAVFTHLYVARYSLNRNIQNFLYEFHRDGATSVSSLS